LLLDNLKGRGGLIKAIVVFKTNFFLHFIGIHGGARHKQRMIVKRIHHATVALLNDPQKHHQTGGIPDAPALCRNSKNNTKYCTTLSFSGPFANDKPP